MTTTLKLKDRIKVLYNELRIEAQENAEEPLSSITVDGDTADFGDIYMSITFDINNEGISYNPYINEALITENSDEFEYDITNIAQLIIDTL